MQKESDSRLWTFFTTAILGVWLLSTPHTFGFKTAPLIYSNWICGILLIYFGWMGRKKPTLFWIWSIAAIGIWLQFTPLVFWAKEPAAYLNDTIVGAFLLLMMLILYPLPGHPKNLDPSIPPGWSFNPSAWPTRMWIGLIAFLCWTISRYLSAYQLGYIDTVFDPFFTPGTKSVLESTVSKAFPVSDAGLGAMAYTFEFLSTCLGGESRWRTVPWAVLLFGVLVIPVSLASTILIILQPLAVGTWCSLCLLTAILMLIAIPFAIPEVIATLQFLAKRPKNSSLLLLFLKGGDFPGSKSCAPTSLDASLKVFFRSMCSGVSFPWNLIVSAFLGIFLMTAPGIFDLHGALADGDPIVGALTVVVSVVAFSDLLRKVHFLNVILGVWPILAPIWLHGHITASFYHIVIGIFLISLSFVRKSPSRGP